jgi:hypothetical protein
MADEELWHVRLSPDEVKILTLDQLDDLFRLEVIEADALVWQPGMDEWLPLNVVAGLGDDDAEDGSAVNIPVSEPPRAPAPRVGATTAVGWPPAPAQSPRPAPPPLSQRPLPPAPAALSQRPAPPPPSQRPAPAPLSQRPAPPAPLSQRPAPAPLSQRPLPPAPVALSQRPAPPPLSQRPAPPPLSQRPTPPSLSQRPAPPPLSQRPLPPAPQSWVDPRPVASVSPFAATAQAQPFAPYAMASSAPSASDIDVRPRARSGGTLVIVLALAAGAAVTLYRNAVVHAAAQSMGQEKSYLQLESALGGPSFGTPRAVERMTEATRSLVSSVAAAAAAPPVAASLPAPKQESEPATPPAPVAEATKTAAPVAVTRAPRAAAASPVVRTSSRSEEPDPLMKAPKKGKKAGKANEYDPLNGNL